LNRDLTFKATALKIGKHQTTVSKEVKRNLTVKRLNSKTPYETFYFSFGERLAALFGIKPIPAENVIQSPKLLKI
jgi:hypothetical protein